MDRAISDGVGGGIEFSILRIVKLQGGKPIWRARLHSILGRASHFKDGAYRDYEGVDKAGSVVCV